jgi:hypothetical protein
MKVNFDTRRPPAQGRVAADPRREGERRGGRYVTELGTGRPDMISDCVSIFMYVSVFMYVCASVYVAELGGIIAAVRADEALVEAGLWQAVQANTAPIKTTPIA